jgi:hypothetical protein
MISVNASAFRTWLDGATVGDELVYHVGDLAADSDPVSGPRARALNDLLDAIVEEQQKGRVRLRQELLPAEGRFQHIARRAA